MSRILPIIFFAFALVLDAAAQPPQVPRLKDRALDKASYVELAKQWKTHIEKNGESAEALVNLGMAYNYSEELETALIVARRAVDLEPDNPRALAFLGYMLSTYKSDDEAALAALRHCRDVAPEHGDGLVTLATVHLRRGEIPEAESTFKTIFNQRVISRPLQDYGYNALVALPEGAVLITGGDNDTYPILVLQAGMDFRRDVVVLNRSLLNLPVYAESQFGRHPAIRPDYNIKAHRVKMVDGDPTLLSHALIKALIKERKAPLFFTVSGAIASNGYKPETNRLEGVNWASSDDGLSTEASAQLFLGTYRLDSATDWTYPWALVPQEASLMGNYGSAMVHLAEAGGMPREVRSRLLEKALAIAEFHDLGRLAFTVQTLQKR